MSEPERREPPASLGLSPAELGLWQAFRDGTEHDLRTGVAELDDPAGEHPWGQERTVRARVIALLLLHGPEPQLGRVASLHLTGAYITGLLDLSGGAVGPYFELRHCRFEQEVRLAEARVATARLVDCRIPRLEAARLTTAGDLHLPRCTVPGGVKLTDAQIGTDLLLSEATVGADRLGRAIVADGLHVGQELQAVMLHADGEVSMRGAAIGSSLQLYGARLHHPGGRHALYAPQLTVGHSLCLADADRPRTRAGIGGPGAHDPFGSDTGDFPTPEAAAAGGSRWRARHFEATGGVVLDDGRFRTSLMIENARFFLDRDQELSLRRITTPELSFTPVAPEEGLVVLSGANVEKLLDRVGSWPRDQRLWMAGFTYRQAIPKEGHFQVRERLAWLTAATPEYAPEPYEQLAAMYRNIGEDTNARAVLLAKQRRRRETLPLVGKVWGYLQDWTVAYGYRPAQAALWMVVLWAAGTLAFRAHPPQGLDPRQTPHWNAALYTLDLLLPVVSFGQDTAWNPAGGYQWLAAALVMLGWVLATTVATGATRLLRRQ